MDHTLGLSLLHLSLLFLFFRCIEPFVPMNLTSAVEPSPFLEYPSLPNSHKARHIAVTYEPFYCSQVANSVLRISANEHGDRET